MADLAHASMNDTDLHGDQDAVNWAERFAARFVVVRRLDGEVMEDPTGLMLAWFAGAIETGKMYKPEEGHGPDRAAPV
jgi:hypothetical protein